MARFFLSIKEAVSETKRDLAEMGVKVHPKTCQSRDVSKDPGFDTLELQNYSYTIICPKSSDLNGMVTQPYCDLEWADRKYGIEGHPSNPGESWKARKDVWEPMLDDTGKFAYTYPERFSKYNQVEEIITRIAEDRDSRQLYISIWEPEDISNIGGRSRIPCSLGYLIQVRGGHLDLTYLQRSCDFATHMRNDMFFAIKLQEYLCEKTGYSIGKFTHWIGSLHVFHKDVEEVF